MENSKEAGEQAVDSIRYDTRWGNNSCQSSLFVVIESVFCMELCFTLSADQFLPATKLILRRWACASRREGTRQRSLL